MDINKLPQRQSDGTELIISILVRFPEVGTVSYMPEHNLFKYSFIIARPVAEEEGRRVREILHDSIDTYNAIEGRKIEHCKINIKRMDDVSVLELERDLSSLTREEISLTVSMVHDFFQDYLVKEENDFFLEEELAIQEELIEHMLENIKAGHQEKNIIAFREEGRVLVFNK
ncbi:MAG: hypothetical protein PWQ31_1625 [Eubacteriales bacterium]|nr:hypothetical protein [Eubacteriales bacterium]